MPKYGVDDVARAVAWPHARLLITGPWPRMSAESRASIINRFADAIERRGKELGTLEARDVGKPVAECINHDVPRAAKNLRFFAAAAQTWTTEASFSDARNFLATISI